MLLKTPLSISLVSLLACFATVPSAFGYSANVEAQLEQQVQDLTTLGRAGRFKSMDFGTEPQAWEIREFLGSDKLFYDLVNVAQASNSMANHAAFTTGFLDILGGSTFRDAAVDAGNAGAVAGLGTMVAGLTVMAAQGAASAWTSPFMVLPASLLQQTQFEELAHGNSFDQETLRLNLTDQILTRVCENIWPGSSAVLPYATDTYTQSHDTLSWSHLTKVQSPQMRRGFWGYIKTRHRSYTEVPGFEHTLLKDHLGCLKTRGPRIEIDFFGFFRR